MSKKKFKDGLESLFGGPAIAEPSLPENSPLLEQTEKPKRSAAKKGLKIHSKRSKSGKNFTSDLDTLFEVALSDTIRDKQYDDEATSASSNNRANRRGKRLPVVGLDALIQRTTDDNFDYTSTKKRVTFIFEKKKLDKLKRIAKLQNSFLKDIIGQIVGKHIAKYNDEGKLKA